MARATIIRCEINGKVVAYSYGLIPISKHTNRTESGFTKGSLGVASFIDDKGIGALDSLPFLVSTVVMFKAGGRRDSSGGTRCFSTVMKL